MNAPTPGTPVHVLWAVSPHHNPVGAEWHDGEVLSLVTRRGAEQRLRVRSRTPRGRVVEVDVHPDSVRLAEAA